MVPRLDVLKNSGIEIENDPMNIKPLPPYAEGLRDLLLDFDGIVPLNKVCFIFSEFWITADDLSSSLSRSRNWNLFTKMTRNQLILPLHCLRPSPQHSIAMLNMENMLKSGIWR